MSSIWGNNIKVSIFGESHGKAIGATIDNLPAGEKINLEKVYLQMWRRRPGKNKLSSQRNENDNAHIISGFLNGYTTGTPLCVLIENNNTNSSDYKELESVMRPSHADYPGNIKYKGYQDIRGGGHFSGRLTAGLAFVGAICRQILENRGIKICAHISSIGNIYDKKLNSLENIEDNLYNSLISESFPVIDPIKKEQMQDLIYSCKNNKDSIGGTIECAVYGLNAGIGSPIFENIESVISSIIFSIPAIKGIEFGAGFDLATMNGSVANDPYYIKDNIIKTKTNHSGGIAGGLSNGMPIIFRVVVKPTPSIAQPQHTINITTKENTILEIKGRHDPCIATRIVPVIESACAIAILDLLKGDGKV